MAASIPWAVDQRRWWPTDWLRVVTAICVPLAWWVAGLPSGAVLFLVLGGAMLIRLLRLPTGLDIACQLVFLGAAWAAVLGTYQQVGWLDLPVHAIGTATAVFLAWRLVTLLDPAYRDRPAPAPLALLWPLLGLAALLSVLWEIGEWAGHTYLSEEIGVGYDDTIGDLTLGTLGGALLALPLARRLDRRLDQDR